MARRASLSDVGSRPAPRAVEKAEGPSRAPGRKGKRGVAFWLSPEAFKQLRGMTFDEDRSMQSLMEEATDLLFQSRGKHRLAQSAEDAAA